MKIVIEISQEVHEHAKNNSEDSTDEYNAMRAIANGTPLPEKHGRIADMDEVIKCIEEVTGDDATYAISLIEWACSKRTILESTGGESNGT